MVSKLSFTAIGMPCSGPTKFPVRAKYSSCARAVISLNALEIELDELLCGDLFGPDRTVHVGNCRFLEVEPRRRGGFRHKGELRCAQYRRTNAAHGDCRATVSRTHGALP